MIKIKKPWPVLAGAVALIFGLFLWSNRNSQPPVSSYSQPTLTQEEAADNGTGNGSDNGTGFTESTGNEADTADDRQVSLEIFEPTDQSTVTSSTITVRGKSVASASVFVNDQELKANANGEFSTTVNLDEGENVVYVVAADDFGNYAEKELTVTLETIE